MKSILGFFAKLMLRKRGEAKSKTYE